ETARRGREPRFDRAGDAGRGAADRAGERRGVERHDVGEHQAGHQTSDIRHQRSASGSCTGNRPGDRRTGVSETMTISRRVFVKSGGLALFSLGLDPLFLARAAFAVRPSAGPPDRRMLVCLFQRGAVDGLNMVVPHGDPLYYRERPRIAVPEPDVVDLDGHFGLHPRLAALKPLWENKSLAAIHAIGSPDSTRSNFDAQDYMESGTPGAKATPDGWLTHVNQGSSDGQLAARLADFGQALAAYAHDLGEKLRDVVVLMMSEFGRTVRENGNSGTDHGHATAMLVLGGPVNGGRMLGRWPGLDP